MLAALLRTRRARAARGLDGMPGCGAAGTECVLLARCHLSRRTTARPARRRRALDEYRPSTQMYLADARWLRGEHAERMTFGGVLA
eukprot:5577795-Prymnesium_polylepis.2